MATGWRVVAQEQFDHLDENTGSFIPSMKVSFVTEKNGIRGNVTIPLQQYNADYARTLIDSRVNEIEAVQSL